METEKCLRCSIYKMLYDALRHMKREDLAENFLEIAL